MQFYKSVYNKVYWEGETMLADPSFTQGCVTDDALCINSEHTEASADTQQENTRGILPTGRFHIFFQTISILLRIYFV